GLPGMLAAVHHHPVAILGQALAACVFGRGQHQPAQQLRMRGRGVVQGRDDLVLGNEQHVHRRLRCDVLEAEDVLVLVDDGGRDFAADDLAEDGGYGVTGATEEWKPQELSAPWRRGASADPRAAPAGPAIARITPASPRACRGHATGCRDPRTPVPRPAAGPGPGGWDARHAGGPAAPGNAR